jgi:hypothetical protein
MDGILNKVRRITFLISLCLLWYVPQISAAHLKTETLSAWNEYLATVEHQQQERVAGSQDFLWISRSPDLRARIERGEVVAVPLRGNGSIHVPSGQVHHWVGAVLIKDVTLADLTSVTRHYERYPAIYKPAVIGAKTTSSTDAEDRFSMRLFNHALVGGMSWDVDYQSSFQRLENHRLVAETRALQVCEIEHFGQPNETKLAPDVGRGYIWRLESIARMLQIEGGVLLELETLVLSRDVPPTLHWIADPIIRRVSQESIAKALTQTRDAVLQDRSVNKTTETASRGSLRGAR